MCYKTDNVYQERSEAMDTLIGVGIVVVGCFVVWAVGKVIERITGFPVWGDDSFGSRTPKP